jgi:hypothetical protein
MVEKKIMLKLYSHQQRFIDKNPNKALLCWEGGCGKSVAGAIWLAKDRDNDAIVICPRKIVKKWQNELNKWGTKATVVSKEDFKKLPLKQWSAIVCDEADEFASPLFVARSRSQLSEKLYNLIKLQPNTPILLLSATPIRSKSENLHTLLCYMGHYIDFKKWRDHFFDLKRMPYLPRPAYIPKVDWRQRIRPILEKHADIVLLKDCVDLPPVYEEKIKIKSEPFTLAIDGKVFFDEHRHEQKNKAKEIIEIGKEYRKILVVAYYREQIAQLEEELAKDKPVYAIYGGVKDQEGVIKQAQEADDCYFIVQASIGAGFDADQFSCVVFASMSYVVRDYVQMKFRVRRIHNLHPVKYVYLIAGRCDRAVLNNIELGKDFIPSEWNEKI